MSGFKLTFRRELTTEVRGDDREQPFPELWKSPTTLERDYVVESEDDDRTVIEGWLVSTEAGAYRDCLGNSPRDALRLFASEVSSVLGESGSRAGVRWVAEVNASAYEPGVGRTLSEAILKLAEEFEDSFRSQSSIKGRDEEAEP